MLNSHSTLHRWIPAIALLLSTVGAASARDRDHTDDYPEARDSDHFRRVRYEDQDRSSSHFRDRIRDRDSGEVAKMVQAALQRRGFYNGRVDGMVGPASRSAIRNYQSSHGLHAHGYVDERLLRSLGLL